MDRVTELSFSYIELADYDNTINACKHALQIDVNDETAWTHLGSAYYNKNQYKKAIEALKEALRIIPNLEFAQTVLDLAEKASKENKRLES